MKIEYIITTIIGLFVFGYVADILSGPFNLPLTSPYDFLRVTHLAIYPFTTVSIVVKSLAIFMTTVLIIQLISGQRFFVASGLFFITAALMELYAIQQIATQHFLISLQWTLALSYSAVCILTPCLIYFAYGIFKIIHKNISSDSYE